MEGWVKLPGRSRASWERKYLRLEGSCLCTYEHQPSTGMSPISRLDLAEKDGFIVSENVTQPEVPTTAKSDVPFVLRIESKSPTTCWPSSRLDIMALSQLDKKNWLKALKTYSSQSTKIDKFQAVVKLEKNQVSYYYSRCFVIKMLHTTNEIALRSSSSKPRETIQFNNIFRSWTSTQWSSLKRTTFCCSAPKKGYSRSESAVHDVLP